MEVRKLIFLAIFAVFFLLGVVQNPAAAAGTTEYIAFDAEEDVYMKVTLRYGTKGEDVKLLQSYETSRFLSG
jgi:hypothetical protein